jgi:predicted GH43/DUF377 family glycosyl hydrolase
MFKVQKLGQVFDPRDSGFDWMAEFAQGPATLVFDDFVRVYFSCRPKRDTDGNYVSRLGFVDVDRNDLMRIVRISKEPILPLGGLGEFDEFGTYVCSVIECGPRIVMYYAGITRAVSVRFNTTIGMALSVDGGRTFERYGRGPVLGPSPGEPFVLSGPKVRRFDGKWYMFYIAGQKWKLMDGRTEPVYKIRMARSHNGIDWTKLDHDLLPSLTEEDEAQSGPDVRLGEDGIYHMFFCFRPSGHHPRKEGGLRIGYAWSSDLLEWHRDDAQAGITVSESGWDSEMVRYPHVFDLDGKTYMLYNGNEFGRWGFGLARIENALAPAYECWPSGTEEFA